MNERRAFENSPDVVADARRFVTERLGEISAERARIVELMVSELATNCVRHTTSDFTVEWFNGTLDEPAVYTHALAPARVLAHYQAGIGN